MGEKISLNLPLELVKEVKRTYYEYFKDYGDYCFDTWVESLKKLCPKLAFLKVLEPLQINQVDDLILIRFGLAEMQDQGGEMWSNENSIYRECRSVVIDIRTEEIVIAPFRKFFNLNEVEENSTENIIREIEQAKSVEFTNKLDGSMQCASMYKGDIILTGSMAISPKTSWRLEEGYKMLTDNHKEMIRSYPQLTFIFEFISLKDPHVVLYDKKQEGLYLIGIRDKVYGEQLSYSTLRNFADAYHIPMTEIEDVTLEKALELSKTLESCFKEGWVLNIDGHMVKVKCDDYVKIHRVLNDITSVNVVIEAIAEDKYDDVYAKVPSGYKPKVEKISKKIFNYVATMNSEINTYYNQMKHIEDEKEAMKYITFNVPKQYQEYVRNLYRGYGFNVLKTRTRYKKLNELGIVDNISNLFEEE